MAFSQVKVKTSIVGDMNCEIYSCTFTGVTSGIVQTSLNNVLMAIANDETGDSDIIVYKNKSDASTVANGKVFIDGVNITNLKGFASQNSSQIPLTVSFKVITGFSPGNHTISLVTVSPTSMDSNSYTSASILELPF